MTTTYANSSDTTVLPLSAGAVVDVLDSSGDWWYVMGSGGTKGYFPAMYLTMSPIVVAAAGATGTTGAIGAGVSTGATVPSLPAGWIKTSTAEGRTLRLLILTSTRA